MKLRLFFLNPFFYYAFSFILALCLYNLDWSDLYPTISSSLFVFIISTIFIAIFFSIFFLKTISKSFDDLSKLRDQILISKSNTKIIILIVTILISLEYIYYGGIPIISVLMGKEFNYQDFGIPTLHVFISPYLSVVCSTFFLRYMISKQKIYLTPIFIILLYTLSVYSRAGLFFIFFNFSIIYIFINFSVKKLVTLSICSIVFLYLFGVVGDNRMKALGYGGESGGILILGRANKNFKDSLIPNQFFWSYLYISSPIANLQYKDNTFSNSDSISEYLLATIIPDAISKRIDEYNGTNKSENKLLDESLNVSTIYGASMQNLHYTGSISTFIYYLIFTSVSILICPSRFRVCMLTVLSIMSLLTIFDNLLYLSGFIMQPLLILLFGRITIKNSFLI